MEWTPCIFKSGTFLSFIALMLSPCSAAVVDRMNEVPKGQHGVDIMRVREWYLSGQARQFRQTILLSSFASAEVNALFNRSCSNHAGKVRLKVSHKVGSPSLVQVRDL